MASPVQNSDILTLKAFKAFSYQITAKLDDDNFPVWLQQVEPVLRADKLHRFCVSPQIPQQFLTDENRVANIENPAYQEWELQDQLLLAWIQASLSPSLLAKCIGCRHTWQLWDKVHNHSYAKTRAQARQLR